MKALPTYSVVIPVMCDSSGRIRSFLMGTKGRKIFQGKLTFPGGEMDLVDSCLAECGARETKEEVGLRYQVTDLEEVGVIIVHQSNGFVCRLYFFIARNGKGKARETKDKGILSPCWHELNGSLPDNIPGHYPVFVPWFLRGYRVDGSLSFDVEKDAVLDTDIHITPISR